MTTGAASDRLSDGDLRGVKTPDSLRRPPLRDPHFNPDHYRMSVGDHLDELRSRLIKAMAGAGIAFFGCLIVAKQYLLPFIAQPLIDALLSVKQPPQMYFTSVTDPFFVYLKIAVIGAFVIASPWVLWQLWQFIAAGLYPAERKIVTRYLPYSIGLFFIGVAGVWFVVLPLTLRFFLAWSLTIPLPPVAQGALVEDAPVATVPTIAGDPMMPVEGQWWIDSTSGSLKLFLGGQTRIVSLGPENLAAPIITLPHYVGLVLMLLIAFGISFQLPLVVLGLVRAGILDPKLLRQYRRHAWFVMVVLACIITPGDILTATLILIPALIGLYEVGIWLGERTLRERKSLV